MELQIARTGTRTNGKILFALLLVSIALVHPVSASGFMLSISERYDPHTGIFLLIHQGGESLDLSNLWLCVGEIGSGKRLVFSPVSTNSSDRFQPGETLSVNLLNATIHHGGIPTASKVIEQTLDAFPAREPLEVALFGTRWNSSLKPLPWKTGSLSVCAYPSARSVSADAQVGREVGLAFGLTGLAAASLMWIHRTRPAQPRRPRGVPVLAIGWVAGGVFASILAVGEATMRCYGCTPTMLGSVASLLAFVYVPLAYGLWKGRRWAWAAAILVSAYFLALEHGLALIPSERYTKQFLGLYLPLFVATLVYLFLVPRVQGFFLNRGPAPPPDAP